MADLAVSCVVTRADVPGGPLADLQLQAPPTTPGAGGLAVVRIDRGQNTRRSQYATSPYTHGASLVTSVLEMTSVTLMQRVYGSTAADLEARCLALVEAFSQFHYGLTATFDGVAHAWVCDAASYGPLDGFYDPNLLRALQQVFVFAVPIQPVTTSST